MIEIYSDNLIKDKVIFTSSSSSSSVALLSHVGGEGESAEAKYRPED